MKTLKISRLPSLFILLICAFLASCVMTVTEADTYGNHHRHRHVWVEDVYYDQDYYIDMNTHQEVIFRQTEIRHRKQHRQHEDNGYHGHK